MSSPDNPRDEQYEPELERLRARYAQLPAEEPDVLVDEAIRAAARQRSARRRTRSWSVVAGLVATVGLAAVIVPALLLEAPPPALDREATLQTVAEEASQRERRSAERRVDAERSAAQLAGPGAAPEAAAPPPAAKSDAREETADDTTGNMPFAPARPAAAREPEAEPPSGSSELERVRVTGSRITRLDVERAELGGQDEAAWRRRILELHDAGDVALAGMLLTEFRERFERDDDFTLDDLRQEASDHEALEAEPTDQDETNE